MVQRARSGARLVLYIPLPTAGQLTRIGRADVGGGDKSGDRGPESGVFQERNVLEIVVGLTERVRFGDMCSVIRMMVRV